MKKTIKVNSGGQILLKDFFIEEIIEMFEGVLVNFANDCTKKSEDIYGNINTFDDYYSMGVERLLVCLNKYEPTHCFSTYLLIGLKQLNKDLFKNLLAKKRQPNMNLVRFEDEIEQDLFLLDIEGKYDKNINEREVEYDIQRLKNNLTEEELILLELMLNEEETKKIIAEELQISRPTLNSRMRTLREKIQEFLPEYFCDEM